MKYFLLTAFMFFSTTQVSAMGEIKLTSPLVSAAARGDLDSVKSALTAGENVNQKSSWGLTALHLAVNNVGRFPGQQGYHGKTLDENFADVISFLLDHGANPNAPDLDGTTPLMYAASNESAEKPVIELLLKYGANKNLKNSEGKSAYDIAKTFGNNQYLDLLK